MEAKEVIDDLRSALKEVEDLHKDTVSIIALNKYLSELEKRSDESLEFRKMEHESSLAYYNAQMTDRIEMFRSVIEAGREALKAVVLINGGAAVAALGFIGAIFSRAAPSALGLGLASSLLLFGSGVLAAAVGFGVRYLAQWCYASDLEGTGHTFNGLSILLVIAAYALFGCGVYGIYETLTVLFTPVVPAAG